MRDFEIANSGVMMRFVLLSVSVLFGCSDFSGTGGGIVKDAEFGLYRAAETASGYFITIASTAGYTCLEHRRMTSN